MYVYTHTQRAYAHRRILARTHTHTCMHAHVNAHTCTHAPTHPCTYTCTYVCAHARSHPIYMHIEETAVWCFGVVNWTDYKVEKAVLMCRLTTFFISSQWNKAVSIKTLLSRFIPELIMDFHRVTNIWGHYFQSDTQEWWQFWHGSAVGHRVVTT